MKLNEYILQLPKIHQKSIDVLSDTIVYYPGMANDVGNVFLMTDASIVTSVDIPDSAYYMSELSQLPKDASVISRMLEQCCIDATNKLGVEQFQIVYHVVDGFMFRFEWKNKMREVIYYMGNYEELLPQVSRIDILFEKGGGFPGPICENSHKINPIFEDLLKLLSKSSIAIIFMITSIPNGLPVIKIGSVPPFYCADPGSIFPINIDDLEEYEKVNIYRFKKDAPIYTE